MHRHIQVSRTIRRISSFKFNTSLLCTSLHAKPPRKPAQSHETRYRCLWSLCCQYSLPTITKCPSSEVISKAKLRRNMGNHYFISSQAKMVEQWNESSHTFLEAPPTGYCEASRGIHWWASTKKCRKSPLTAFVCYCRCTVSSAQS